MPCHPALPSQRATVAPTHRTRLLALVLSALLALLSGCPQPVPDLPLPEGPTRRLASSPDAQIAFDAALARYEARQWREAASAFRLFAAEFPNDVLSVRAELYIARCHIALGERAPARTMLEELLLRPDDRPTRDAALLYLGFLDELDGRPRSSDAPIERLLNDRPTTAHLAEVVLAGDEALLFSLVAEARIRRGDLAEAIEDLERVAVGAEDDNLLLYAWDRATELAERALGAGDLTALHARGGLFLEAVTTAPLTHALLRRGDPDQAARVLHEGADSMRAAGLDDRLRAAQHALQAASPDDRLPCYGVILSLSGPDRRAGRAALGAVLLAERAFERTTPATVAYLHDAEGSVQRVRDAVAELAGQGCVAAIGPLEPHLDREGRSAAASAGIAWISSSPVALPPGTTDAVRLQVDARREAERAIAEAVDTRGANRILLVVDAAASGDAWMSRFADAADIELTARGATVVERVALDTTPANLQASAEAAARRLARSSADAVVLALPSEAAGAFAAYAARENIWPRPPGPAPAAGRRTVTWIGTSFLPGDTLLRDAAAYLEHAIIPAWFLAETAERRQADFRFRFEAVHNRTPGTLEAFAYDAASLVQHLILAANATSAARFIERLREGVTLEGVTGRLRFDADGNPAWLPGLVTLRNGAHVTLQP